MPTSLVQVQWMVTTYALCQWSVHVYMCDDLAAQCYPSDWHASTMLKVRCCLCMIMTLLMIDDLANLLLLMMILECRCSCEDLYLWSQWNDDADVADHGGGVIVMIIKGEEAQTGGLVHLALKSQHALSSLSFCWIHPKSLSLSSAYSWPSLQTCTSSWLSLLLPSSYHHASMFNRGHPRDVRATLIARCNWSVLVIL